MKDLIKLIYSLGIALCFLPACSGEEDIPDVSDTGHPICFAPQGNATDSRAILFEKDDDLTDTSKGGGNFTVKAFVSGTGEKYLDDRVYYLKDYVDEGLNPWVFYDGMKIYDRYWAKTPLDFFAYMPYNLTNTPITVNDDSPAFSCNLPATASDNDNLQEFICAYETGKMKADEETVSGQTYSALPLTFYHPFAVVCFQLGTGSSRMTVNSIGLKIHLAGGYSCKTGQWTPTDSQTDYTATINKRIPNDFNYNTIFGGPFLVMPQQLAGATFTLNAVKAEGEESITKTLPFGENDEWLPGKRYIYTLHSGDNNEEIYFYVTVEDWIVEEYKNIIDVE